MEPITMTMLGVGAGLNILGSLIGSSGKRKAAKGLARQARANVRETRKAWDERISSMEDVFKTSFEDLSNLPEFEMDTRYIDEAYANAVRASERVQGRAAGEEIAQDMIRQSTADAVGRASSAGGSVADILGFVADAETRERRQMSEVSSVAIQERNQRLTEAMNRLEQAGMTRTNFYQQKEQAEFQSEYQRLSQLAEFKAQAGSTLSEMSFNRDQAIMEARNQAVQAQAAFRAGSGDVVGGIISGMGSMGMQAGLMGMVNGGFGGGRSGDTASIPGTEVVAGAGVDTVPGLNNGGWLNIGNHIAASQSAQYVPSWMTQGINPNQFND